MHTVQSICRTRRRIFTGLRTALPILMLAAPTGCEKDGIVEPPSSGSAVQKPQVLAQSPKIDTERIALFGSIVSVEEGALVLEVYHPRPQEEHGRQLSVVLPGLGPVSGKQLQVSVGADAFLNLQGEGLSSLPVGTPIMVAGALKGSVIDAHFVGDMRQSEKLNPEQLDQVEPGGTWGPADPNDVPPWLQDMVDSRRCESKSTHEMSNIASHDPAAGPVMLDFWGEFGGYAHEWHSPDLDIVLFVPIPYVEFEGVDVLLGFGGSNYDFPFSFDVNTPQALVVGSDGDLQIQVEPELPVGDHSFYWALGIVVDLRWKICWLWECDRYTTPLSEGWVNTADGRAPMPGETMKTTAVSCPGWDAVGIPGVSVLGFGICLDHEIGGAPFESDISAAGANYSVEFDGQTSVPVQVRASTNPLQLTFDDFYYWPNHSVGVYFDIYLLTKRWRISPTIPIYDGTFHAIPTWGEYPCPTPLEWLVTCGDQPESLTFAVPTIPVVTSVAAAPQFARRGEPVTLTAVVEGANGPGNSPKVVTFWDGDQQLGTTPIDAQDVATLVVSDFEPCVHDIKAEFVGIDPAGNTYPSSKSTVEVVRGNADFVRMDGYWQHQCSGSGNMDFDFSTMQCYMGIVDYMSSVFNEHRDVSTMEGAHDVLHQGNNRGEALSKLERELFVAWLNFSNGSLAHNQLLDTDGDGAADTPFIAVLGVAESVCMDPNASAKAIKEQTRILHRAQAFTAGQSRHAGGG